MTGSDWRKVTLLGNLITVEADFTKKKYCQCGAEIYFAKTATGKFMPICQTPRGFISHFANCPRANKFRKKK
jgi:hypothetical protein